jgi:hypothetical protein
MLAEALRAEVDAYIAGFAGKRDENGRRLVVRNGYHEPREVLTSACQRPFCGGSGPLCVMGLVPACRVVS